MGAVRLALACSVFLVGILASAASVSAHIGVTPGLLVAGDAQTVGLSVHNDLDRPMTGLSVSVPGGIRVGLGEVGTQWEAVIDGRTATWTGGRLAPNTGASFEIVLDVGNETPVGPIQLQAKQLYPGGGSLLSPIPLTVIPAADESSQRITWAIVGTLALLATAGIALIAFRRRVR